MQKTTMAVLLAGALAGTAALTGILATGGALARERHERGHERHEGGGYARSAMDPLVKKECGACHMVYPARLLPARSWEAIMAGLEDHFDGDATLDPKEAKTIETYLVANAEDAGRRRGRSRRRASTRKPLLRITKARWFVREHRREVSARSRKRAGVMGNCVACHRGAERGYFDDD